jgi:hypothetical protein
MRCPECNKFAGFDDSTDPEVDDLEVDESGNVTGSVRIVLTHDECGTELKESSFELSVDGNAFKNTDGAIFNSEEHEGEGHELDVECDSSEITQRSETTNPKTGKPIAARYAKSFYGYGADLTLNCSCGKSWSARAEDDVQASAMDEMV